MGLTLNLQKLSKKWFIQRLKISSIGLILWYWSSVSINSLHAFWAAFKSSSFYFCRQLATTSKFHLASARMSIGTIFTAAQKSVVGREVCFYSRCSANFITTMNHPQPLLLPNATTAIPWRIRCHLGFHNGQDKKALPFFHFFENMVQLSYSIQMRHRNVVCLAIGLDQ